MKQQLNTNELKVYNDCVTSVYFAIMAKVKIQIANIEDENLRSYYQHITPHTAENDAAVHKFIHSMLTFNLLQREDGRFGIQYGFEAEIMNESCLPILKSMVRLIYTLTDRSNTPVDIEDSVLIEWLLNSSLGDYIHCKYDTKYYALCILPYRKEDTLK